jgi:tetratricopeptide (TPR) repeat protein
MGVASKQRKPNERLRYQRHLRGWTLRDVADKLYDLCASEEQRESGMSADTVGRWELGVSKPSLFYQQKLCVLFETSAEELGLIEPLPPSQAGLPGVASRGQPVAAVPLPSASQPIDLLAEAPGLVPEELLGAWLAAGAIDLSALFAEGWTLEEVLNSLQVVLKGVQAMPNVSRGKLLQLGAAAMLSSVAVPEGNHLSAEERSRLHSALGESIAAGWKLFHTSSMPQVLAVGQAQLFLVQQASSNLYPSVQAFFYSVVYRLIGAVLHFQSRYEEAYQAHEKAYIAALEGADAWNMAQSRSWQAYGLRERGNYLEALQVADAALQLVSHQNDTESIRLRARLLAFSAENAALLNDAEEVKTRLSASEKLLEHLPGYHEEFDGVSWLQQAGSCALSLGQYDVATARLQQALDELPRQWTLRFVSTAVPLVTALTRTGEMEEALLIAEKTIPVIKFLQSPALAQEFNNYLQAELIASFPNDKRCKSFVVDAQRQLALA